MKKRIKDFLYLVLIILMLTNIVITSLNKTDATTKSVISLTNDNLEIFFLDVGQGDSTLIRIDNKFVLIDAGNVDDGKKLVDFFKSNNIDTFEYVIATHPHEDHIGGMKDIIENFNINNFYMADVVTTTKSFEDMLDAMINKSISYKTFELMQQFNVGDANFTCFANLHNNILDLNDASIVLGMTYYNTKYLFTADATANTEKTMLKFDLKSDVLKVSHHGSKYSTTNEFLNVVRPKYAIISVGDNNIYNLPSKRLLNRLINRNIEVYRTDELGTIKVTSDGNNIKIDNLETDTNGGNL